MSSKCPDFSYLAAVCQNQRDRQLDLFEKDLLCCLMQFLKGSIIIQKIRSSVTISNASTPRVHTFHFGSISVAEVILFFLEALMFVIPKGCIVLSGWVAK